MINHSAVQRIEACKLFLITVFDEQQNSMADPVASRSNCLSERPWRPLKWCSVSVSWPVRKYYLPYRKHKKSVAWTNLLQSESILLQNANCLSPKHADICIIDKCWRPGSAVANAGPRWKHTFAETHSMA